MSSTSLWKAGCSIGVLCGALAFAPPSHRSTGGVVASDHPLASDAGAEILKKGGNAVDATIAAVLAAGVVQLAGSGLGGGGFAIVDDPADDAFVLDFRERAPQAAHRNMYVESRVEKASRYGGLAVAIPNEANGLIALHRRKGSLSLKQIAKPSIQLSQRGFVLGQHLLHAFGKLGDVQTQNAVSQSLWNVDTPTLGATVQHPRLAKTIRAWAKSDGEVFRTGWVARDIVDTVQQQGGILELSDMAEVQTKERSLLKGKYRGWTVMTMPPPSSGGLVILQVLSVLEAYDVSSMGHNSSDILHLYAETFQHAFADRANFMGDPDRIDIPMTELLSAERIQQIKESFTPEATQERSFYGTAVDIGNDAGTQHISVVDKDGMSVSVTTTINTEFGSRVVGTESGILLNNEMDDFVAEPGKANYYGLIGSEANSVAPRAVPLSSMSPTILVSPDGKERIVIGASGGPLIITSTIQVILNILDFGMEPSLANSLGRIHHQWVPEKLFMDDELPKDVRDALTEKGHALYPMPLNSSVQVVHCIEGACMAASDPRKGGQPAGLY